MLSGGRRADARALCPTGPHSSDGRLVTRCAFFQGLRVRDERGLKHAPKSVAGDPVQPSLAWGQSMMGEGWTKEAEPPCPTGWRGGKRNGWAVILSCLGGGRAESGRIAISGRMMSMDRSSQRGPCGNGVSSSYLPTQPSSRHGGGGLVRQGDGRESWCQTTGTAAAGRGYICGRMSADAPEVGHATPREVAVWNGLGSGAVGLQCADPGCGK